MEYKVMDTSQLQDNSMTTVRAGGKNIMLAQVDGQFFATDDSCTHELCSLGSEGFLDGSAVICGCHGSEFDLTSGKVMTLPATVDLQTYPVTVKDGAVWVTIG
jgi:nitrite reductase/ring-hydroxylating ferredoxin subunit